MYLPSAGFEPAIPASERPQTDALDHAATGIGISVVFTPKYPFPGSIKKNTKV